MSETNVILTANDRSFRYGDGFFETFVSDGKGIPLLSYHYSRIKEAFQLLQLAPGRLFSEKEIGEIVQELCKENDLKEVTGRIVIWRKEGGWYAPDSDQFHIHLSVHEKKEKAPDIVKIGVAHRVFNNFSAYSGIKSNSSLQYVLAGLEMKEQATQEIIILDSYENISECLYSNLWWVKNNELHTPNLGTGCVNGASRRYLLEHFPQTKEVFEPLEMLSDAEHIFLSNAVGIRHVLHYQGRKLKPYPSIKDVSWI